jgi:hypothetical protein
LIKGFEDARVNVTANWRLIRSLDPAQPSDAGAPCLTSGGSNPAYWGPIQL